MNDSCDTSGDLKYLEAVAMQLKTFLPIHQMSLFSHWHTFFWSPMQVMIAEKAADLICDVNTVKAIQDYFKHMVAMKHKKIMEDDDAASTDGAPPANENEKNGKEKKK